MGSTDGRNCRRHQWTGVSGKALEIILMASGFDLYRTAEEANILSGTNRCSSIEAVRSDEIYAVNANAYFSKPGIRTITGLDILAKIIDPIRFADLKFICKDRNMNKTNQTCHVYNSKSTWLTSTICKINTDIDYKKNVIAKIYK
ncbi:MAG: hypothetical protein ACJ71E_07940 [Nitrososphaeraceae archaeon]